MKQLNFTPENYRRMIKAIDGVQHPESIVSQGERIAAMVLSKTQAQLTKIVAEGDLEAVNKIADTLAEAEQVMRSRLDFIQSALARLMVVDDPELNAAANPQA